MRKDKNKPQKFTELRRLAEKLLPKGLEGEGEKSPDDRGKIIHELQVHQIELEIQNEELRKAQSELEESRNKYHDLYDFAPIGYLTLDDKGLIQEVNIAGAKLLGIERRHLIKTAFSRFISMENQDVFYFLRQKLIETKLKQTCEIKLKYKDGTQFFAQLQCVGIESDTGNFNGLRVAVTDISDRKAAEEKIRDLAKFPSENPNPVLRITKDGQVLYANEACLPLLAELHTEMGKLMPTDWCRLILESFDSKRERVEEFKFEERIFSFVIAPVAHTHYANVYGMDITERKKTEEELRKYRFRLEKLVKGITDELTTANEQLHREIEERKKIEKEYNRFFTLSLDMFVIAGIDGYFKLINPAFEKTLGYTAKELLERQFFDFVHPEDKSSTSAEMEKFAAGISTVLFENRYQCKDGSYKIIAWSALPVKGEIFYAVGRDITQQKQIEEALRKSEESLRKAQ